MGLFSGKKRNKEETETESVYKWMTIDDALAYSRGEKIERKEDVYSVTREICNQIINFRRMQAEAKKEYAQVTEYLADIQKLELMTESQRSAASDAARQVLRLEEERIRFAERSTKMPEKLYRVMDMYADDMPTVLKDIEDREDYLRLVQEDMRQLEGERGSIEYEKEQAEGKKKFLTGLSYGVAVGVIVVFIALIVLMSYTGKDFMVPFFITGAGTLGYIAYFVVEQNRCRVRVKKAEYALNRVTQLTNKVKIKLVNTTNSLDYSYEKYKVAGLRELQYNWQQYRKCRDEENRYKRNVQSLEANRNALTVCLEKIGIVKTDAWVHQPEAVFDRGELADFRDTVSKRRRKLRAQLDFNARQIDVSLSELEALKAKYKDQADVIAHVMEEKGI